MIRNIKKLSQRSKFVETARKAGCDESEAAFEGKLKRIAKAKKHSQAKKRGGDAR